MLRRIKLEAGELGLIRDLHLHLQEIGGGTSEAEALWGKKTAVQRARGRAAQSGQAWMKPQDAFVESVRDRIQCPRCHQLSASVHLESSVFGVLSFPGAAVASLSEGCLQTSRIHFS